MKIGIIGIGNMGKAVIDGLPNHEFVLIGREKGQYKNYTIEDTVSKVDDADIIFLCVKPSLIAEILEKLPKTDAVIISVAVGLTLDSYGDRKIVRTMPTLAIGKNAGVIGYAAKNLTSEEKQQIHSLLSKLGSAIEMEESLLDPLVGISGSAIAYFAHIIGIFIEKAKLEGFDKEIVLDTVKGAIALLEDRTAKEVCEQVASKGGTTEQGLNAMKEADIDRILGDVIDITIEKAKSFGGKK